MSGKGDTLVILTPAFPKDPEDTVWVPSKQLFVKKLQESFPALHIIVLAFNYPRHTEHYEWNGVQVVSFDGLYKRRFKRVFTWWKVWKQLRQLRKQHRLLGIFSFWCGECALVGKYFAGWHGIRFFCWISGLDATAHNKLVKLIRPQPGELVAMSHFLQQEFHKNHLIKPAHFIPIGIDPDEFLPFTGQKDIDLLGVGSFNPFKQYDVFIRIVKKIAHTYPAVKAVICGGGTEQPSLQRLIKELELENNIELVGVKPHREVLQWMQRAKVFLHPSSYEGFGAVHIEALYAGAQVISFTYPLDGPVPHWQVASDANDMMEKATAILQNPDSDHAPVLFRSMNKSAEEVMALFQQ